MEELELKECPFCGTIPQTKVAVTRMGGDENHISFTISCPNCGVYKTVVLKFAKYVPFTDVDKAESEAIKIWNKRVYTDITANRQEER